MKEVRIKDICDKGSSSLKQKDVEGNDGKYPVYGASGIIGKINTYHQEKEYIAIVKDGSGIGRVTFMPAYSSIIGTLQYILPKEGYNIKYISYCLQSLDLAKYKQGAAIPHIYFRDYGEYLVKVTDDLSEQERIVSYLDAEFAKIDALKANIEQQLQASKDLFQSALKEMLTPKEGWEEKKLGEICEIARGGSPRPIKDYITNAPNSVNWIKIGDTDPAGKYIYETKEKIKPEGIKKSRWVEKNDFILSNSMSFGRPYILKTNGCIHDGWLVLRNYNKDLYIDFFYYVLTSPDIQHQFTIKAQGSTVSNLNTDRVASVSISFPSLPEQERIADLLDSLSDKVKALQENYNKALVLCNDLKQSLLKSIFE